MIGKLSRKTSKDRVKQVWTLGNSHSDEGNSQLTQSGSAVHVGIHRKIMQSEGIVRNAQESCRTGEHHTGSITRGFGISKWEIDQPNADIQLVNYSDKRHRRRG